MKTNLTVAIAQLRPKKSDYTANLARLGEVLAQLGALAPRPDVLVLPETFLSGYFLEGGVREQARTAGQVFADINATYLAAGGDHAPPLDIVVGFYERYRDRYYNSALYATCGAGQEGIRHVHRKVFLPTYGVFDDARFVEAGTQVVAFPTAYGCAALLICEDAWHSVSGLVAALDGAQIIFVLSASPARGTGGPRPDNVEHWEDLARRIADTQGVFVAVAQLVGFEGGKGFAGNSLVLDPRGQVVVAGPLWDEALVTATIDLDDLPLSRADMPLLADLETMLPHMQREIDRAARHERPVVGWDPRVEGETQKGTEEAPSPSLQALTATLLTVVSPPAFDPDSGAILHINADLVHRWLVEFLRDEVTRRRGFRDVVLALSGGVDSSLVAFLCAEAFGPDHVLALRLPYRTSSHESLDHAQLVIDQLGIRSTTIDISPAVDAYASTDPDMDGRRKGNIMARMRMIILFDYSQKLGMLPIGTGNKTERLFGYFTWHADDSPPVNPLGDLFKTQVWQLARHLGVPPVIVDKPASADLIVGQTDEADFGISYPQADRILHFLVQGYGVERLKAMGFPPDDVGLVKQRLDGTHWKRHLPSTAVVSATAIGEFYLRPLDY
ncbi:MAG: NAD+ synthase [Chloroflexaceae bacterium]|nr:NAD+ synthase [Chloroflexaceae bacterium]